MGENLTATTQICIPHKLKAVQYKIIHNVYPTNKYVSKCVEVDNKCEFCKDREQTVIHIITECQCTARFWRKMEDYLDTQFNYKIRLDYNATM